METLDNRSQELYESLAHACRSLTDAASALNAMAVPALKSPAAGSPPSMKSPAAGSPPSMVGALPAKALGAASAPVAKAARSLASVLDELAIAFGKPA